VPLKSLIDRRGFATQVLPAVAYTIALFCIGASHASLNISQDFVPQDKLNHFGAFGLLVWLAYRAIRFERTTASSGRIIWASIAVSSAMGVLLELWQMFFPYRSAEVADWVADTLGALVAGYTAHLWLKWRRGRVVARE